MLEVEGGTKQWCMRIMRHEAGHAIDTAFGLHRKRGYKATFGSYHAPYPETYVPKPRSKKFVFHLEPWYAQSHPAEDFAETFAVWMTPNSALAEKLSRLASTHEAKFVDSLMERIQGKKQSVVSRAKVDPVHRIDVTLREHYQQRQQFYSLGSASVFDAELKKLFCEASEPHQKKTAASYLRKKQIRLLQSGRKVVRRVRPQHRPSDSGNDRTLPSTQALLADQRRQLKARLPFDDDRSNDELPKTPSSRRTVRSSFSQP